MPGMLNYWRCQTVNWNQSNIWNIEIPLLKPILFDNLFKMHLFTVFRANWLRSRPLAISAQSRWKLQKFGLWLICDLKLKCDFIRKLYPNNVVTDWTSINSFSTKFTSSHVHRTELGLWKFITLTIWKNPFKLKSEKSILFCVWISMRTWFDAGHSASTIA